MDEFIERLNQPLLKRIVSLLPANIPIYLVGGAVRDALLDRQNYDLDLVTGGQALKIARHLADELGAAYYPLDVDRNVARLVIKLEENLATHSAPTIRIDISAYQGADLFGDLAKRDFTINAMAVDVHHLQELIDPLGGAADLLAKRLRACSPSALRSDPVRILRAVRFSVNLELRIMNETLQLMREATPQLPSVSAERIRDELFRILASRHPGSSARIMDNLGVLEVILPEVCLLKEVAQSSPHIQDAWNHTLSLLDRLETLLDVLSVNYDPDKADNLSLGMVVMKLGRFRRQLEQHLANYINPDRSQRSLLFLAGFYHDAGKNASQSIENDGKIRFIGHEQIGSRIIRKRGKAMKLSGLEIERLATIVGHHMRPSLLSHEEGSLSKKAIYHYFRDTGPAGVDICLLSLADVLATYGPTLPPDRWSRHLDVVRLLLEAWWEDREERIFPAPLINGDELITKFDLDPSPLVGYLLEAIREAQVSHEVTNKEEAITLAERLVQESLNK